MEEAYLLAHMEDLARKAQKIGVACSRFLSPAEAAAVSRSFERRRDISFSLDGGYEGAERKIAVFVQPDWGSYQREDAITALRLRYRTQDSLSHRDILGAFMALGMERSVIGDIHASNPGFLVCIASSAPFILTQLTQAGRVGIKLTVLPLDELAAEPEEQCIQRDTVASLRLDAVLAACFRISRSEAAMAIERGLVQCNHELQTQGTRLVQEGDVLSLRGKGRVTISEIGSSSRKGRIWISFASFFR